MSCVHYQSTDPPGEKTYLDVPYSHCRYTPPSYSPRVRTPEVYKNGCYSGFRTSEFRGSSIEATLAAKGDSPFAEQRIQQADRTLPISYKHDVPNYGNAFPREKIQAKLKFLEDSNIVMQARNQNLLRENKGLTAQLEEQRAEGAKLEERMASLMEELNRERSKLEEMKKEAERTNRTILPMVVTNATSTTNIISKADRGVQVWAVCKGCQRKLESCEKEPPTVTITKSELEVLEKDMQTLRDTIIAREEAWDKAMEREQNYRQQLARLTAETITARHLSETRYEELQAITNTLSEKESELKTIHKDNLGLNKLIAKMYNRHQRVSEDSHGGNLSFEISEKDQKLLEEIVRRVSNAKSKQKSKAKNSSTEKTAHFGFHQGSPRENKILRAGKDQAGSLKESKR